METVLNDLASYERFVALFAHTYIVMLEPAVPLGKFDLPSSKNCCFIWSFNLEFICY